MHKTPVRTIIAFAYADVDSLADLRPTYYGMMDDLVSNIRETMPGVDIVQISNEKAQKVKGITGVLRVPMSVPLMVWRMKAHQEAHGLAQQVIFVEPDVRFKENILDVFDDPDFDVAVTKREMEVNWNGAPLSDTANYTLGCTYSRSAAFWRKCKNVCDKLSDRDKNWIGDMKSMAIVIDSGKYKVKLLDGPIYNHVPNSRDEVFPEAKVLHFKGKRKQWLFKLAQEAA